MTDANVECFPRTQIYVDCIAVLLKLYEIHLNESPESQALTLSKDQTELNSILCLSDSNKGI